MGITKIELRIPNTHQDVLELHDIEHTLTKITKLNIRHKSRQREYVNARGLFYFISSAYTSTNITAIARFLNKHHANVLYHLKQTPYMIAQDPELRDLYDFTINHLNDLIESRLTNKNERVYIKNIFEKVEFLLEENKKLNSLVIKLIEVYEHEKI